MTVLGWITAFDGTTIINGTTAKHRSMIAGTEVVRSAFYTLPNGTKMNYDGTGDPVMMPGPFSQHIVATDDSHIRDCLAKLGMRGTATLTRVVGAPTKTCTAILTKVEILPTSLPSKDYYEYIVYFEQEDDWA